jgi:hypothetical protein
MKAAWDTMQKAYEKVSSDLRKQQPQTPGKKAR